MLEKKQLNGILEETLKHGGDYAELFIEEKKTSNLLYEDNKIEKIFSGTEIGAGLRLIDGVDTLYAFTNDLSEAKLREMADSLARAIKNDKRNIILEFKDTNIAKNLNIVERPDEVKMDDKTDLVKQLNSSAREVDTRVRQVTVGYGDLIQKVTIANSAGKYVEDERIRSRMFINVIAAENELIQTGYDALGGTTGYEIFRGDDPEKIARSAAKRAVLMLSAKPAPAGKMPVVMAGEAGGTMVHEACGHGLEADLVQKKLSVYANKIGQKVAAEEVTVIDDSTINKKYGSYQYDDEGNKARKNILIEKGILKEYLYDYLSAKKEKRDSTGNGRRESYQARPIPRMSNTYIDQGKIDPEEIIKSTKKGIYVKKMGGGQVNTINGDFVFDVPEGYLIEDGEIKGAIRGATLTGNGPQVLQTIDMIGNDLGFAIGTCGKDGQGVAVSDAQPTLRIPEMIIGGILEEEV